VNVLGLRRQCDGRPSEPEEVSKSAMGTTGSTRLVADDSGAEGWFYDRYQSARVNGNRWFLVSIVLGTFAALAVFALALLAPLKSVHPFLVEVNSASGEVRVLKPFDAARFEPSDAVVKSFLSKYVIARETYDPQDLKQNYEVVRLLSDPPEGLRVDNTLSPTNAASPLRRYANHTVRTVRIKSVSLLNSRTGQVRFMTSETTGTGTTDQGWVAILSFRFVNLPEIEEERLINPLGFQVTAYRVDQEVGQ
jgi:type IV secretion system protein VirB8